MADLLTLGLLSVAALTLGTLWARRQLPPEWLGLFVVALVLRIVGSTARLEVMDRVYSGVGDARMYFEFGQAYAGQARELDFAFATSEASPTQQWWGSQFIRTVTAFVVLFTAGSFRGTFFVFALFAFTGLVLSALASHRASGPAVGLQHTRWIWLLPSLWFWPSSIGKEAVMLLAAGLAAYGYVGDGRRTNWWLCAAAVALAGAIRPHVAAVIAVSIVLAETMRPGEGLSGRRIGGLVVGAIVLVFSVQAGLSQMGLGDADLEGIQEHFEYRSAQTSQGGSKIAVASGWASVPMALITILMRPFPWEVGGVGLLSAAEIAVVWILIAVRWRGAFELLRGWRSNAFLRFGLPFMFATALMYGLAFANLGIIARQRAVILPVLLLFLVRTREAPAPVMSPLLVPARRLD